MRDSIELRWQKNPPGLWSGWWWRLWPQQLIGWKGIQGRIVVFLWGPQHLQQITAVPQKKQTKKALYNFVFLFTFTHSKMHTRFAVRFSLKKKEKNINFSLQKKYFFFFGFLYSIFLVYFLSSSSFGLMLLLLFLFLFRIVIAHLSSSFR